MKKILSIVLVLALLLTACASAKKEDEQNILDESTVNAEPNDLVFDVKEDEYLKSLSFTGMDDPAFLQFIEDSVSSNLVEDLGSEEYQIEEVSAIYLSKEYLEDLEHNSQANIFFGFTLDELELQFEGSKFEFALDEDGHTIVREFEEYDDTYDRIIKNVAIGAGVILVLVVITVATSGSDVPALVAVCAVSGAAAEGAAIGALSGMLISGAVSFAITGLQTKDWEAALKAAALSGSEGFKWGAITGAISGGTSKIIELHHAASATNGIPSWRKSELTALSKYGGEEQVSYLAGEEVAYGTYGATRPDVVRTVRSQKLQSGKS